MAQVKLYSGKNPIRGMTFAWGETDKVHNADKVHLFILIVTF